MVQAIADFQDEHFHRDGFGWCRGFADGSTCEALKVAIAKLNQNNPHGLRNLDKLLPAVAELCTSAPLVQLAARYLRLSAQPPRLVRAIFFDKTPETNWGVPWHQDKTIAVSDPAELGKANRQEISGWGPWSIKDGVHHVQPDLALLEQMVTLRLHLDDATLDNGCLRVMPGSHRLGLLPAEQVHDFKASGSAVDCCAAAGDILLMRPLLLHSSLRGQQLDAQHSSGHRRIIHLEFCAATLPGGLHWA